MSSEKRDPKKKYGNTVWTTEEDVLKAFQAVKDNAKESLPPDMFEKVVYYISWKYTP
jgi:hypothetical protein